MRKWCLLLALALVAVLPAVSGAAVSNTQHDIDQYTGTGGWSASPPSNTGGTCSYCHLPHKAAGARLFPSTVVISGATYTNWMDNVKTTPKLCASCHNGSSGYTATPTTTVREYENTSHGAMIANLAGDTFPSGVRQSSDNTALECTSCHDVHSNTMRPFLSFVTTDGDLYGNCIKCHTNRGNNSAVGSSSTGQHPTNLPATTISTMGFLSPIDNAFKVAVRTGGGTASSTGASAGWILGGHLAAGASGNVRCQTCHAVHGTAPATGSGGSAANDDLATIQNKTVTGTPLAKAALCEGCHTANPSGSGGNTGTHPVDTASNVWQVSITKPSGSQWGMDNASRDVVTCSSCHTMHYASPSTSLWAKLDNTTTTDYGVFCSKCHTATNQTTWTHHPVKAVTLNDSGTGNMRAAEASSSVYADRVINWAARTRTGGGTVLFPGLASNIMTCATCHVGGGSKAHNSPGTFPGLVGTNTYSQLCVQCHSFNPSTYLTQKRFGGASANNLMTHFVGQAHAGTGATYLRSTAFGNSKIQPKYDNSTTPNSIICESCHALKKDSTYAAINSGAAKQVAKNSGTTPTMVSNVGDNITLLIEQTGNAIEITSGNEANYLCTGCHGAAPGGSGSTHPTLPAMTVPASAVDVQTVIGGTANTTGTMGRATLTPNKYVNCDSCHRPHNATIGTGAVILESQATTPTSLKLEFQVMADNAYLNQEGLCSRCHSR